MAIDSASDLDAVTAAYLDNCSYAETADLAKCQAFVTACRALLVLLPKRATQGERLAEVEFDMQQIGAELKAAVAWAAAHPSAASQNEHPGARYFSLENFRE